MQCKDCVCWNKRPLPDRRKGFYPAGRCDNIEFNKRYNAMFTTEDTNCSKGIKKES